MYHFILNPTAGKGRTLRVLDKLTDCLKARSADYEVHFTKYPGHASEIARELSAAPCNVVCIGGDGTVSEVLNGIDNFENVRMGIIPCGTGNDFAASAALPIMSPEKALSVILDSEPKPTDFLQIGNFRSMNVAGIGIDVDVLERYNRRKHRGKLTYTFCLIGALLALKWMKFDLTVDGNDLGRREAMITSAANGKFFGGGMIISSDSQIDDGLMELVVVNKIPKWKMILPLLSLKRGTLLKYDFVESIKCKSIDIRSDAKKIVNVDGELKRSNEFACKLIPGKLLMYRP